MECGYCEQAKIKPHCGTFDLKCPTCRVRFLLSEPCKVLRQYMAEDMARKFDVPEWQIEPNCGCKHRCKRHRQNTDNRYRVNF